MNYFTYGAFGLYLALIVGGGLAAVTLRNLVRAFVGLLASLFGVAGMYFLMNAPFVALMQVLIYVCAVCILIFLAVMITEESRRGRNMPPKPLNRRISAVLGGVIMASLLTGMVLKHPLESLSTPKSVTLAQLGTDILGAYGLAFELISVALFVGMVGSIILVYEKRREHREGAEKE